MAQRSSRTYHYQGVRIVKQDWQFRVRMTEPRAVDYSFSTLREARAFVDRMKIHDSVWYSVQVGK